MSYQPAAFRNQRRAVKPAGPLLRSRAASSITMPIDLNSPRASIFAFSPDNTPHPPVNTVFAASRQGATDEAPP